MGWCGWKILGKCFVVFIFIIAILIWFQEEMIMMILSRRGNTETTYLDFERKLCIDKFTERWKFHFKKCPNKGILTVHQGGRLGNHVFEYASIWALSKEIDLEAYVPRCIENRVLKIFSKVPLRSMEEISHCPVNMANFVTNPSSRRKESQGIALTGWNNGQVKIVAKWSRLLPKDFPIKGDLLLKSNSILLEARKKGSGDIFIGVHVRKTDYTNFLSQIFKGQPAGKEFFFKAMDYYEKKFQKVTFVVTSDDRKWCKQNLGGRKNLYIAPPGSPEDDLVLMSCCNHSIFEYGTFGGWGALYAGGETVYYNATGGYRTSKDITDILPAWHTL